MYDMIDKVIKSARDMYIIGGDFDAELGQGIGGEKLSVGQSTLKEANKRREWLKQWLMLEELSALNTMCKKKKQS